MSSTIQVKNLTKSYDKNEVLSGISFSVKKGTMLALLGPNGAGKTTTVKILSSLVSPDGGEVFVKDIDVVKLPQEIKQYIGLTGQSASVDELLTGRENLVMMGRLYRLGTQEAKKKSEKLLKEFDLTDAADRPVKTYSGGMRRRLDLAVSLIASPEIIFLDEPTTGLDPRSRLVMWDIIENLKKSGTTILLTTQYLEEADKLADNIILINNGSIAAEGTAKSLKDTIKNDRFILTFKSKADVEKAAKLLGNTAHVNTAEKQVSIGIKSDGTGIQNILSTLTAQSIPIVSTDINKPTLDDVFLNLTEDKS